MVASARNISPKEPIKLNGIVVITMIENFGDSNWAAITTKIREDGKADCSPQVRRTLPPSLHPYCSEPW